MYQKKTWLSGRPSYSSESTQGIFQQHPLESRRADFSQRGSSDSLADLTQQVTRPQQLPATSRLIVTSTSEQTMTFQDTPRGIRLRPMITEWLAGKQTLSLRASAATHSILVDLDAGKLVREFEITLQSRAVLSELSGPLRQSLECLEGAAAGISETRCLY